MGIFDGMMLISDYDGTLYGDVPEVSQENIDAIRFFQDEGGIFLVCSGRCWAAFYEQAKRLPLRYPTLLSNGATLCDMTSGENYFCRNLPDRCKEDMITIAAEFPDVAMEVYHGEDVYCHNPNYYVEQHQKLVKSGYTLAPLDEMPQPWLKVLFEGDHDLLEPLRDRVLADWGEHYECIFSAPFLLELTGKGVHKGFGVTEAAKRFGIAMDRVYCIGDNENDLPMLYAAAQGFIPAGSALDVMGIKDFTITRDASHSSVAHVVELLRDMVQA